MRSWASPRRCTRSKATAWRCVYARLALFARPDLAEAALLIGDMMAEQENLDAAIDAYQAVAPALAALASWPSCGARGRCTTWSVRTRRSQLLEKLAAARAGAHRRAGAAGRSAAPRRAISTRLKHAYSRAIDRLGEPKPEHWTLFYARGIAYERTKQWPEAEKDFLYALELEPEQPFVLNYLGYSWVDMGMHLDRAKGMLYRAVELRPDDGFIVDSLGWVHYRLGEYAAAVEQLERAVELEPGDPVINDHLGDAYWRVGRHREARYQWRRALTLEPEEDTVAAIEEKLRQGLPKPDQEPQPDLTPAGMPPMRQLEERAPAKVNLDLRLTGRRAGWLPRARQHRGVHRMGRPAVLHRPIVDSLSR